MLVELIAFWLSTGCGCWRFDTRWRSFHFARVSLANTKALVKVRKWPISILDLQITTWKHTDYILSSMYKLSLQNGDAEFLCLLHASAVDTMSSKCKY